MNILTFSQVCNEGIHYSLRVSDILTNLLKGGEGWGGGSPYTPDKTEVRGQIGPTGSAEENVFIMRDKGPWFTYHSGFVMKSPFFSP